VCLNRNLQVLVKFIPLEIFGYIHSMYAFYSIFTSSCLTEIPTCYILYSSTPWSSWSCLVSPSRSGWMVSRLFSNFAMSPITDPGWVPARLHAMQGVSRKTASADDCTGRTTTAAGPAGEGSTRIMTLAMKSIHCRHQLHSADAKIRTVVGEYQYKVKPECRNDVLICCQ